MFDLMIVSTTSRLRVLWGILFRRKMKTSNLTTWPLFQNRENLKTKNFPPEGKIFPKIPYELKISSKYLVIVYLKH